MKVIRAINRFFTWICMALIVGLMLLMVGEVLSRALFHRAILGSTEIAQVLLVCNMTAFGAAVMSNRQIKVNMLTAKFPMKVQVVLDVVMLILCFLTISVLSWQQFNYAFKSYNNHIFYTSIEVAQWPFIALFSLGYAVAALTILSLVIRKIVSISRGEWEKEFQLEDMDEIFVFGKNGPPVKPPMEGANTEMTSKGGESDVD